MGSTRRTKLGGWGGTPLKRELGGCPDSFCLLTLWRGGTGFSVPPNLPGRSQTPTPFIAGVRGRAPERVCHLAQLAGKAQPWGSWCDLGALWQVSAPWGPSSAARAAAAALAGSVDGRRRLVSIMRVIDDD